MSANKLVALVAGLSAALLSGCGQGPLSLAEEQGERGAFVLVLGNGTATQPTQVIAARGRDGQGPETPPTPTLPAAAGPVQTIEVAPYDPSKGPPGHDHGSGGAHPGNHCHYYVRTVSGWAMYHC